MKYLARSIVIEPFYISVRAKHSDEAFELATRAMYSRFNPAHVIHSEIHHGDGDEWEVHLEVETEVYGEGDSREAASEDKERAFQKAGFSSPSVMTSNIEYHNG